MTPRLCEMYIRAVEYFVFSSLTRSSTAASTVTSNPVVGSSSSSSAGLASSAMAITTRCFWPPESWLA